MYSSRLIILLLTLIVFSFALTSAISAEPCDCIPGDANGDGDKNVGDIVYLIESFYKWGPAPTPYPTCSADANNDGAWNVGDAVHLINYVFKHGPRPPTCEEWTANWGELR